MNAVCGGVAMVKSRLSPREIVQRLQIIETLTAEGLPVAKALRSAGIRETEYERWRVEYNGLRRTLGPLLCATTELVKRTPRTTSARSRKAVAATPKSDE
jgi:putative transposase